MLLPRRWPRRGAVHDSVLGRSVAPLKKLNVQPLCYLVTRSVTPIHSGKNVLSIQGRDLSNPTS